MVAGRFFPSSSSGCGGGGAAELKQKTEEEEEEELPNVEFTPKSEEVGGDWRRKASNEST